MLSLKHSIKLFHTPTNHFSSNSWLILSLMTVWGTFHSLGMSSMISEQIRLHCWMEFSYSLFNRSMNCLKQGFCMPCRFYLYQCDIRGVQLPGFSHLGSNKFTCQFVCCCRRAHVFADVSVYIRTHHQYGLFASIELLLNSFNAIDYW